MSFNSSEVRTQLFFSPLFMHNNIHIPLNADPRKRGYFRAVTATSLSSLSKCWGQPRLTLSRQFSQRTNVINGCQLRGVGVRLKKKKSHPKEIVAEEKVHWRQFISSSKNLAPLAVATCCKMKCSMSLSKFKIRSENAALK